MQNIVGDSFDTLEGIELLEIANTSIDELKLESFIFNDNEET